MQNIPYLTLIKFWKKSFTFRHGRKGHGLSIIVPFRTSKKYGRQDENYHWIKKYWKCQLPGCEIIRGNDHWWRKPFSKSLAVNAASAKATGDIFVIADVDCYIDTEVVLHCAEEIRRARKRNQRLWFVPYRKFFRLTDAASQRVLDSDPGWPHRFPTPPRLIELRRRISS